MKISNEAKVGGFLFLTLLFAFVFAWVIGIESPFRNNLQFYLTYHFAGGIEVGSPVRFSGIKIGKVEKIEFFTPVEPSQMILSKKSIEGEQWITPLKIKVSVRKDAAQGIRKDSQFFINLAGIIGERYIEITPGRYQTPPVQENDVLAGIDPPRIDQLISQSFDLAGKVKEVVEENRLELNRSLRELSLLTRNVNQTLFRSDVPRLIHNLIDITQDVKKLTHPINTPEGERTLQLLYQLIWRLEPLDSEAVRTFFRKEGIKVRFF